MGNINDYWKVYQRCLIPKTPPDVDLCALGGDGQICNYLLKKNLLLARWTSDFDCGKETEWYYVIKDDEFDISKLKAKRRYEINKGNKNFYSKVINPVEFSEEIYFVASEAYSIYPQEYRPNLNREEYVKHLHTWLDDGIVIVGVFDVNNDKLCGFAYLKCASQSIDYSMHKVLPSEEKRAVNAALVFGVLKYFKDNPKYRYICDGSRAIKHKTAFQDYLEKYFGFRKAYCSLHIVYHPLMKAVIRLLYPFKEIIKANSKSSFFYNLYCILEQERIRRTFI